MTRACENCKFADLVPNKYPCDLCNGAPSRWAEKSSYFEMTARHASGVEEKVKKVNNAISNASGLADAVLLANSDISRATGKVNMRTRLEQDAKEWNRSERTYKERGLSPWNLAQKSYKAFVEQVKPNCVDCKYFLVEGLVADSHTCKYCKNHDCFEQSPIAVCSRCKHGGVTEDYYLCAGCTRGQWYRKDRFEVDG